MRVQAPPARPTSLPAGPLGRRRDRSSTRQIQALLAAIARGLAWGLPAVSCELRAWRRRASAVPDRQSRTDALSALDRKRGHAAGAALFAFIPHHRSRNLLGLLVAYETIWDFLDTTSERAPEERNGRQLHLALVDALNPAAHCSDWYRHHPSSDEGYLTSLVAICRVLCTRLPAYSDLQDALLTETWRAQVLALNHESDTARRNSILQRWVRTDAPIAPNLAWFELSGAASASLTIHALLARASEEPACGISELSRLVETYNPWISAATTMLDSHVDQLEDAASGDHSYVAHYPSRKIATLRIGWLISESLRRARALPEGHRHCVIVAAMCAMYLSKQSASDPRLRGMTHALARAGGPLTALLLPLLRLWRITFHQRTT